MKKAFTLIEVVAAIAILAMVLSFSGVIFKAGIEAYRVAGANAEIMQKFRAITDQLNADFKGLRKDAPLLISFSQDNTYDPNRFDQIMFFANGDFQSTQLYDYGKSPVVPSVPPITGQEHPIIGNLARLFYGQAKSRDPYDNQMKDPDEIYQQRQRILARRQHILTADSALARWPDVNNVAFSFSAPAENEWYEHDRLSLSQWKTVDVSAYNNIVSSCFGYRPLINLQNMTGLHMLMCQGLASFTIQWAYWDPGDKVLRWYPSNDPYGNNTYSHFALPLGYEFGVYFNVPNGNQFSVWYPIGNNNIKFDELGNSFPADFYPKALKFTFRLCDSKGIVKEYDVKNKIKRPGRTFTHIVYLDN